MTEYLLDVQPGLFVTLTETAQSSTKRFIHGPRGVHALQDNVGDWAWLLGDGLGSVRAEVVAGLVNDVGEYAVNGVQGNTPFGLPRDVAGTFGSSYGFTGEPTDYNDLVHMRARYLNPELGVFPSLDPFEGVIQRAMSLNGYSWVEGRTLNWNDPLGLCSTPFVPDNNCQGWQPERCCGPDVTEWFKNMLARNLEYHGELMEGEGANLPFGMRPGAITSFPIPLEVAASVGAYASALLQPDEMRNLLLRTDILYRYAAWGLVVRSANINYQAMAQTPQGLPQPDYAVEASVGDPVVTLCDQCIRSSDIGNFLFGLAGHSWGIGWDATLRGAQAFNALTEGIAAGHVDMPDIQAVMAGFVFSEDMGWTTYPPRNTRDAFCFAMELLGYRFNWHEPITEGDSIFNETPCRTSNLDNAPVPVPHWNTYIYAPPVQQKQARQWATPEEEFFATILEGFEQ